MELSIIVPIYNVEKYLPKCIESILAQTFTDFELILVDDGSPDGCGKIIDDYAKTDSRIVVIHQKNQGVSAARNVGLRIAKGKYIGFVDPDDYIHNEMYRKLIDAIKKNSSDITCCGLSSINKLGECKYVETILPEVMSGNEFLCHLFDAPRTIYASNVNKLFVRDKINVSFDETLSICEDWLFLFKYICNISKAAYVNEGLYYAVTRSDSATHTIAFKNLQQLIVREKALKELKGFPKITIDSAEADFLDVCIGFRNKLLENNNEELFNSVEKMYRGYVGKHFIHILINRRIKAGSKLLYIKRFVKFK